MKNVWMFLLLFVSSYAWTQKAVTKEQVYQSFKEEMKSKTGERYAGKLVDELSIMLQDKSSVVVLDSVKNFSGDGLEWSPVFKEFWGGRDDAGRPGFSKRLKYDDTNNEWGMYDSTKFLYGTHSAEALTLHWFPATQSWSDTSMYYFMNDQGLFLFFFRYYDEQTNEIRGGFRVEAMFNEDSTYYVRANWDTVSQGWMYDDRDFSFFDASGNVVRRGTQTWDAYYQIWRNSWQDLYFYDAENRISEHIQQQGAVQNWDNTTRQTYTYDEYGDLTLKTGYRWNESQLVWDTANLTTYEYDEQQREVSRISQIWDDECGCLQNYKQVLKTYEGNEMTQLTQYWDGELADWENSEWEHYVYNDAKRVLSELSKHWNTNQEWINYKQFFYEYIADTLLSSSIEQTWDVISESWINNEKGLREYDENGRFVHYLRKAWNFDAGEWENDYQTFLDYDQFGEKALFYDQYWEQEEEQWFNSYREEHYYSQFSPSGIQEGTLSGLLVFPNPAHDFLQVGTAENMPVKRIYIYNETGQEVLKNEYEDFSGGMLSVRLLYPGVYFIRIEFAGGKTVVRKFVKK